MLKSALSRSWSGSSAMMTWSIWFELILSASQIRMCVCVCQSALLPLYCMHSHVASNHLWGNRESKHCRPMCGAAKCYLDHIMTGCTHFGERPTKDDIVEMRDRSVRELTRRVWDRIMLYNFRRCYTNTICVKAFKSVLERKSTSTDNYFIQIHASKTPQWEHQRRYNAPVSDDVGIVIVGEHFNTLFFTPGAMQCSA